MFDMIRRLIQRRRVARELDDELRFHVEMETQAHIARGVSPAQARRRALAEFGGIVQTHEAVHDVRRLPIESLWQDVRYAARTLGSNPGFTFAAAGMLALGIGITTAMFTVVDSLLLRPVPFRDAGQLARLGMGIEPHYVSHVSPAVLRAWRESPAFDAVESAAPDTVVLDTGATVVTRRSASVTPGIFELLGGVRPVLGRLFDAAEGRAGHDDRVLLSEDVWRSLYGADPDIVGRSVVVNGARLLVIGVLPSDFRFPSWDTGLWRPIDYDTLPPSRAGEWPRVYVRLSRRMPLEEALRLAAESAALADARTARMKPQIRLLTDVSLDDYTRRAVPALAGAVGLVFLILCANVCSLLLGQMTTRRGEFSMRAALGASRGRLLRQAFAESAALGALGLLAGAGLAWVLVSLARIHLPDAFLLRTMNPLDIDLRALLATSVAGVAGTMGAGLLPAWLGTRVDAGESLRIVDRGGTEARGARVLTRGLLVVEVALACTLLVGATLLVRSFVNLQRSERGLDTSGVLVAHVFLNVPMDGASTPEIAARTAAVRSVIADAVRGVPGIGQTAWSLGGSMGGLLTSGDFAPDIPGASSVQMAIEQRFVGPEFFELYGVPLLRGRTFMPGDDGVVIVGERMAAALWPGLDPVDRAFTHQKRQYRVIGLARETHVPSIDTDRDRPEFYAPYSSVTTTSATLSIRCVDRCPDGGLLRRRIATAHPSVQLRAFAPLDDAYLEQLAKPRAAAALAFAFAAIAVLAAAGGLFSVLSYAVGRRRREFGIHTALGASPRELRRLVLRDGVTVATIGIVIGALAAASLTRFVESMQYGVTMSDPVSWAIVLGLIAATTLAAAWRPARAAARLDPVVLLREE